MEQTEWKPPNPRISRAAAVLIVVLAGTAGVWALANRHPVAGVQESREAQKSVAKPAAASRSSARRDGVAPASLCSTCGVIESVRAFELNGEATGVRGGTTGREMAAPLDGKSVYRVTIRMDDGSRRTISLPLAPGLGVGEKVRIIEGPVVHG
jgi:hypothetical protein